MLPSFEHFFGKSLIGSLIGSLIDALIFAYPIFVLVGVLIYRLSVGKNAEKFSVRAALKYVFPADIYRHQSFKVDLWAFPITIGVPVLYAHMLVLSAGSVQAWLLRVFGKSPVTMPDGWAAVALQVVVVIVAADFGRFLWHYLAHKVPFFWSLHKAHHSAEVLNPAAVRVHPLDNLTKSIFIGPGAGIIAGTLMYLGGMRESAAVTPFISGIFVVLAIFAPFTHSHIWISYGRTINHIFYSPCMHLIHHSALPRHRDKNLGGILSLWDYLFGTLYVPEHREEFPFGLSFEELGESNPHPSFGRFLIEPVTTAVQTLRDLTPQKRRAGLPDPPSLT